MSYHELADGKSSDFASSAAGGARELRCLGHGTELHIYPGDANGLSGSIGKSSPPLDYG